VEWSRHSIAIRRYRPVRLRPVCGKVFWQARTSLKRKRRKTRSFACASGLYIAARKFCRTLRPSPLGSTQSLSFLAFTRRAAAGRRRLAPKRLDLGQIVPGVIIVGLNSEGRLVLLDGRIEPSCARQGVAEVVVDFGDARLDG